MAGWNRSWAFGWSSMPLEAPVDPYLSQEIERRSSRRTFRWDPEREELHTYVEIPPPPAEE